jgi:hypothetical protein
MRTQNLIRIVVAAALLLTVVACAMPAQGLIRAGNGSAVANNWLKVDRMGSTAIDPVQLRAAIEQLPPSDLSTAERDALLYMREEEKLAHDVYVTLAAQWSLPIFQNIANSETTHTEAVQVLLDRYGLTDPTVGKGIGIFTDATLQALYDQLVAEGSQSLAAALRVGATIEDLDIVDLQDRLAQTDNADIEQVFTNLTRGSRNHLRAFTRLLVQETGEGYTPQYLDQALYDEIINSAMEQGSPGRGRNGR